MRFMDVKNYLFKCFYFNFEKYMIKFLFSLLIIFSFYGCNKTKNKLLFSGYVYSPNEQKKLQDITVELQGQLIESGTFNSNFQTLQKVITQEDGFYYIENENVRAGEFRILAYSDNYITAKTEIKSDEVIVGEEFQYSFNLYPKAYLKIYVKNVIPADSTDEISINIDHNSQGCNICYNIQNRIFSGDNVNDTLLCLIYGNQMVKITYTTNTASGISQYSYNKYCPAFATTEFWISY